MGHYVTNKDFLEAIKERQEKIKVNPDLIVSNYLGECILKICTNLAHKNNFNGYSYKDEMIADGIENCLAVIDKFDPTKSDNPFAYFTQCAFFAFIRRIQREKRQQEIKGLLIQDMISDGTFTLQDGDESSEFDMTFIEQARNSSFLPTTTKGKKVKETKEENGLLDFCKEDILE